MVINNKNMTPKEILKKEPFKRIEPYTYSGGTALDGEMVEAQLPNNSYNVIPQEKFLSELNPSGHQINLRPDKVIKDKDGHVIDYKPVAKIAVALQQIISTKQKIHLVTNPLKWTLTEPEQSDEKENIFNQFKQSWIDKNMHIAISEVVGSLLETGDAALYFYRDKGVLGWRSFSFQKGDVLMPHYDNYGNLKLLGRLYSVNGATMLDTIDDKEVVSYFKKEGIGAVFSDTWAEVKDSRTHHGFSIIPVCYIRNNDVCWGDVQSLIDSFENGLSNMSENNRYYANMILFLKGNIQDLPDRDDAGKILVGKDDADAKFLATPESNEAQSQELDILLKQIFMGSFTVSVSPDTVSSGGDLPGVTVKLLFSPAVEKALDTAKLLDSFIDNMVVLFKDGYGIEVKKPLEYTNLKLRGEINIYVPENTEEFNRMLNESLTYGSISKKTASEKNTLSVNGEFDRIKKEVSEDVGGTFNVPIDNNSNSNN